MGEPEGEGPIKFQYIVGGGPFMDFDFRIVGGPDDGRRLTHLPERDNESLRRGAEYYNGSKEEFWKQYGRRPCWRPHFWSQQFLPETVEAATKHFGPLCEVYKEYYSEEVEGEWEEIIKDVFDVNYHDTRYGGGCAALYAAVLHQKFHFKDLSVDQLEKAANKFISETMDWHERHRHNFKLHPHFDGRILEIARNGDLHVIKLDRDEERRMDDNGSQG